MVYSSQNYKTLNSLPICSRKMLVYKSAVVSQAGFILYFLRSGETPHYTVEVGGFYDLGKELCQSKAEQGREKRKVSSNENKRLSSLPGSEDQELDLWPLQTICRS